MECPSQYLKNPDTMTCDFIGEIAFPLPFSIATCLIALGLLVARFMKNQTRYLVTLIAFSDVLLKANWVFLVIYLFAGEYYVSAAIIIYCVIASVAINAIIWRIIYHKTNFSIDHQFSFYLKKYPLISKFLIYSSFIVSFQVFRLTYSRFLGK